MKTSDKLLVFFFGLILVILVSIQFSLYGKYKKGEFSSNEVLLDEEFAKYNLNSATPLFISITGFQNAHLIPSDSFYFRLEKSSNGRADFRLIKDSLYLEGESSKGTNDGHEAISTQIVSPMAGAGAYQMEVKIQPELNPQKLIVYCPSNVRIRIAGGEIFLHGSLQPGKFNISIEINNCHLELGNDYSSGDEYSNRFYNDIAIHSFNSGVAMNSKSVISSYNSSMDDRSILIDNNARIDSLGIDCTNHSRLELTGRNIRKIRFIKDF
jgi:hypothetical protein